MMNTIPQSQLSYRKPSFRALTALNHGRLASRQDLVTLRFSAQSSSSGAPAAKKPGKYSTASKVAIGVGALIALSAVGLAIASSMGLLAAFSLPAAILTGLGGVGFVLGGLIFPGKNKKPKKAPDNPLPPTNQEITPEEPEPPETEQLEPLNNEDETTPSNSNDTSQIAEVAENEGEIEPVEEEKPLPKDPSSQEADVSEPETEENTKTIIPHWAKKYGRIVLIAVGCLWLGKVVINSGRKVDESTTVSNKSPNSNYKTETVEFDISKKPGPDSTYLKGETHLVHLPQTVTNLRDYLVKDYTKNASQKLSKKEKEKRKRELEKANSFSKLNENYRNGIISEARISNQYLKKDAAIGLLGMAEAARSEGVGWVIHNAYMKKDYADYKFELNKNYVNGKKVAENLRKSTKSQKKYHPTGEESFCQSGYMVCFSDVYRYYDYDKDYVKKQENTDWFKWLTKNGETFGFERAYPKKWPWFWIFNPNLLKPSNEPIE